jgi:hypothetical protein
MTHLLQHILGVSAQLAVADAALRLCDRRHVGGVLLVLLGPRGAEGGPLGLAQLALRTPALGAQRGLGTDAGGGAS